ncbi:InlB B-repeat-containing protein [Anaerocolumna xylanovorans]|uniref:Listeria/Bacterioides repeat-containing protein n=1 Tax=Anaerocolumna xylanovorans DSM 12503 TaxID=1121345 RepID=A0A1M7Y1B0_9FIRM|nr:InlB B-repeat-containing protein [Anaerocolumna xylanovorans]SHO45544.1 Listeria/Bacterioides repeat-containing protein [Anaerocolumna xylanovorans DSM 12503]
MRKNNKTLKIILLLCLTLALMAERICPVLEVSAVSASSEKKKITVTFDPGGGTLSSTTKTVTIGSTYGKLPVPVKKNYTFRGWYIFPSGGTMINAENKVTIAKDQTLYAQWSGQDFTITLDAGGGTLDSTKVTVRYGTKYLQQLPTPVKTNYEFNGWYTQKKDGDEITASSVYELYNDKPLAKLYARWTKRVLTVKFIAFNGETYEKEVTCGAAYGTLPKPQKKGYTFQGWFTWKDYTDSEASPIVSTAVATDTSPQMLFARWY